MSERTWIVDRLWQCGMVSVVVVLTTAIRCFATPEQQSFKLVQTFNKSELASNAPFNGQGLLAVRTDDVVQLWDTRTGQLKVSLTGLGKILKASFSSDGATFITSSRAKSTGLVTKLWDVQTGRLKITVHHGAPRQRPSLGAPVIPPTAVGRLI